MMTQPLAKKVFLSLTALLILNCSGGGGDQTPPADPCYDDTGSLLPACSVSVSCKDEDNDAYTVSAPSDQTTGLVGCSLKTDCDDVNAGIFPEAIEVLSDGIDQNCDGVDGVNPDIGTNGGSTTGGSTTSGGTTGGSTTSGGTTGGTTSGSTTTGGTTSGGGDSDVDGDGVFDNQDNAPGVPNPDQTDSDGDGIGDVTDDNQGPIDSDSDGTPDQSDNCPSSPDNLDTDGDGTGNPCDNDDDGDGVLDGSDNCVLTPNPQQEDNDADGIGNNCDTDEGGNDSDGDGIADDFDNCDQVSNAGQEDADNDQIGNACDSENGDSCSDGFDNDGDGLTDAADTESCGSGTEQACADGQDNDADGQIDTADCDCILDADGDNYPEDRAQCDEGSTQLDNCPAVANATQNDHDGDGHGDDCDSCSLGDDDVDTDSDGTADACEGQVAQDSDGDSVVDSADNCSSLANADQLNTDADAQGDVCDVDDDDDGLKDSIDPKPLVVNKWGYFDKDLTGNTAQCVQEYILFVPQNMVYKSGMKKTASVGVTGAVSSKATLPLRKNCRQYMVHDASSSEYVPSAPETLDYNYGIYIMNGTAAINGGKGGGGEGSEDEDEPEVSGIEVKKLKFYVTNLNMPEAGLSLAELGALYVEVYFTDDDGTQFALTGCTLNQYADNSQDLSALRTKGASGSFELDLTEYAEKPCLVDNVPVPHADNFSSLLKISKIKSIHFKSLYGTQGWGIKSLAIEAIDDAGTVRPFYRNQGVWAWVRPNNNIKYPEPSSNCLGNGAHNGFHTFPGDLNIHGLTYYNVKEFPHGELIFSPQDYYVELMLKTQNQLGAGSLNTIFFKFKSDCSQSNGQIKIFDLTIKDKDKSFWFYSSKLSLSDLRSGIRFKLGNSAAGNDKLMIDTYRVVAWQAWSNNGKIKKFSRSSGVYFTLEEDDVKEFSWPETGGEKEIDLPLNLQQSGPLPE